MDYSLTDIIQKAHHEARSERFRDVFVTLPDGKRVDLQLVHEGELDELRALPAITRARLLLTDAEIEEICAYRYNEKRTQVLYVVNRRPRWRETNELIELQKLNWLPGMEGITWDALRKQLVRRTVSRERLQKLYDFFTSDEIKINHE